MIQVMDDWNDQMGIFGGHKLTAVNPDGFHRFVDMVHQRGIKILAYASSGFFTRTDPDYHEEWSRRGEFLHGGYWNMARCSPANPGWRAHLLPRVVRILDEFDIDGLFNDAGYVNNARKEVDELAKDEVAAFEETPEHDGALADMLQIIYEEVHRRGGISKLHMDLTMGPLVGDAKVYDYLWVGEGNVGSFDNLRTETKNHSPYVVPCIQFPFLQVETGDEQYIHAIPYMQFPLLEGGRPYTGERAFFPGIDYSEKDKNAVVDDMTNWRRMNEAKWKYHQAHPDGPYIYSGWGPVPPQADYRETHARWLKRYLPLVENGTRAWLEISDSSLFSDSLPADVVASVFANREIFLVLANYGKSVVEITTVDGYVRTDEPNAAPAKSWSLASGSLEILCRRNLSGVW